MSVSPSPSSAPALGGVAVPVSRAAASSDRPAPREHRYDIDLIRLLCSFGVILGHAGALFVSGTGRGTEAGQSAYWAGMTADAISRYAVPMYFAIAGWAVLVGAPPKNARRLWQRLVRILLPLAVWTAVYLLWGRWRGTNESPIGELALESVFASTRPAYHLWYLYAYVPIVMLLAFAAMVRSGKRPWGLGAALLAVAAAPTLFGDLARVTDWDVPRFGWGFGVYQIVYAVLGALLFALPAGAFGRRRWPWPLLACAAVLAVLWYQHEIHYVIPNASVLVALLTGAVLLSLNRVRIPERWRPRLAWLANGALGAYMVHVLVLDVLGHRLISADLGVAAAVSLVALLTVATALLSFGASLLWGRLGLRRFLG
ncbi:acyltransferase [Streptomyces sp. O3]